MKKLFTIAALVAVSATVSFAQRSNGGLAPNMTMAITAGGMDKADSTLLLPNGIANPAATCDSLVVYTVPQNGGYVTGFNAYGDLEKASLFAGSGNIIAVFAQVALAGYNTGFDATEFKANVYSVNLSDSTFTLSGSSLGIPVSSIDDSTGALTVWPLASPVAVSNNFAVSVEVGNYGSTTLNAGLVLFSNKDDCGNGATTWEKFSDNSWHSFNSGASWGLDIDVAVGAVATAFASNPESELITGTVLYPNPVVDGFNLSYTSKVSGSVNISIYDAAGRAVKTINEGSKAAGSYISNIGTEGMASGLYVYRISVGGKTAQGKFMVK